MIALFSFSGLYLFGDIYYALGTIFGVIVTLNNRGEDERILRNAAFTGVFGGIFSSVFISIYEMILGAIYFGPNITIFFLFLGVSIISGIVIGLIGGALIGTYYLYREMKGEVIDKEETLDDDFFDDLVDK
jgi:hypothetical protein